MVHDPPGFRRDARLLGEWIAACSRVLFPPVPIESARDRRAALLIHAALWGHLVVCLLSIPVLLFTEGLPPGIAAIPVLVLASGVRGVMWLRAGKPRRAGVVLVAGGWGLTTLWLMVYGSIRAPAIMFYVLAAHLAGLLFGTRGVVTMVTLCSASVAALVGAQNGGWLPQPDYAVGVMQWASVSAGLASIGGLAFMQYHLVAEALRRVDDDLRERHAAERELLLRGDELRETLQRLQVLQGLLPVCGWCRKVCDDSGYWRRVESYIAAHSDVRFEIGTCPDCLHAQSEAEVPGRALHGGEAACLR